MKKNLRLVKSLMLTCLCALALTVALWPTFAHPAGAKGNMLEITRSVSYKNLTLFLIRSRIHARTDDYITLDEGIKNGTVVITEKGSAQIVRRTRGHSRNQRVVMRDSDSASVNQLALINRSGKKLLLLAGEVIVGGKQDRIVEEDLIVPPVSVPISLNVFCVEHGRWSSQRPQVSQRQQVGPYPARPDVTVVQSEPENFSSLGAISHPKLRAAAQDKKEQGEVWKEVSANNVRLGTANTTDTYQEVYQSKRVGATMEEYIAALGKEVTGADVVGVVVARNGELVWIDMFASPSLFAKYWPKLLKSYAVDAMGEQLSEKRPTLEQARAYFYERQGATTTAIKEGVYRLSKAETSRYAVFRLEDISLSAPFMLHFNKMQR